MIDKTAMLARLTQSAWEGFKYDPEISREIQRMKGSRTGTGRYNKRIVPEDWIKELITSKNTIYRIHTELTLPWLNDGSRVLTGLNYFPYVQKINTAIAAFDTLLEKKDREYPDIMAYGPKLLGSAYKKSDYPPPSAFRSLFSNDIAFTPVPTGDIRLEGLGEAELAEINASKEREIQTAVERALGDVYGRIHDAVGHMAAKLHEYNVDKNGKVTGIFRDSLIENVRELAALLPNFNFTDDPLLDSLAKDIAKIAVHEPEDLRLDDRLRAKVATKADDIMARLAGVYSAV